MVPSIQETKRNESIRNERKKTIHNGQDDRINEYEDQK